MTEKIVRHNCNECGVLVNRLPAKRRDGTRCDVIYCSKKCYDKHRTSVIQSRARKCGTCDNLITNWSKSRKYCSEECWKSQRKAKPKNCVNCGCWFTAMKVSHGRLISVNDAKTCSAECLKQWASNNQDRKDKISKAFQAEKHPNWQGGSHRMSSRGPGWEKLRSEVRKLAGYKCEHCGMTEEEHRIVHGGNLQVNHKVPFHQFGGKTRLANRKTNLEALCRKCHTKADWKWRKENQIQLSLAAMFKS